MSIAKTIATFALTAAIVIPFAADAQRARGRTVSVQGANGRGGAITTTAGGSAGSAYRTRSIQTNSGRGATSARSGTYANGVYTGGQATTLNNGTSFGRSTIATVNGGGSADVSSTLTGPRGNSTVVSGTASTTHP